MTDETNASEPVDKDQSESARAAGSDGQKAEAKPGVELPFSKIKNKADAPKATVLNKPEKDVEKSQSAAEKSTAKPEKVAPKAEKAELEAKSEAAESAENGAPAAGAEEPPVNESTAEHREVNTPVKTEAEIAQAKQKRSNIVVGTILAVAGVVAVATITMFTPTPTPDQNVPYLLDPLEKHLDANLRYKVGTAQDNKDWRHDFIVEQNIWTSEISKITLGRPDAKPADRKRDFLLFLGDSYFKDEPHWPEARAAYLQANVTPRSNHEKAYDYWDGELWRRIAYCDIRMGDYEEADNWLKKALASVEAIPGYQTNPDAKGLKQRILDATIENDARRGELKSAQSLIEQRLKDINLAKIEDCIEPPLLYDQAVTFEQAGELDKAAAFYAKAVKLIMADDNTRGTVIPETVSDKNRNLARVLMGYSHVLRKLHRNSEALATMRRALAIYDNPPA